MSAVENLISRNKMLKDSDITANIRFQNVSHTLKQSFLLIT